MKRAVRAFMAGVSAAACVAAAVLSTRGNGQTVVFGSGTGQIQDRQTVVFGSGTREVRDGWGGVTAYSERESFTWSLMQDSQNHDYAMAEIAVSEEGAAFDWTFGEERDSLLEYYRNVKNGFAAHGDREHADYWLFLKVKTEDVYDLDIWHGVQEARGSDLEEDHDIFAAVNRTGRVCEIREYGDGIWIGEWCVYIKDDFLYVLACADSRISSSEETKKPINYFYWEEMLDDVSDYCTWGMDDELFYWRDHDGRVTRLENPERVFTQVPGTDDRWSHFPGKQPCGILKTAEYTVSLSKNGPELRICFTLGQDAAELELPDIGPADYAYTMEVSDAAGGELLQTAEAFLCVDAVDTLRFQDMDGDGFLDMHIVYPAHSVVAEADTDDMFSFQYYWYSPEKYWIWNNREHMFVRMTRAQLSGYVRQKEDVPEEEAVIVQEGDSLWGIARKYLGDGAKYADLYEKNRDVIGGNPDMIMPGMEISLKIY